MTEESSGPQYVDGLNLYWALDDNPVSKCDPRGTDPNRGALPVPPENPLCFAAGTQILMTDGSTRSIETIETGQMVLACPHDNPEADPTPCRVTEVYHNSPARLLAVTVRSAGEITGNAVILVTDEHPFYVPTRGWVGAKALQPGDRLKTNDGLWAKVESVADTGRSAPVFNLQVDGHHTYFVVPAGSARGVLVHNNSGPDNKKPEAGDTIYRVYGGGAAWNGTSWTPTDPRTVPNFGIAAGLPGNNAGTILEIAILEDATGVLVKKADPVPDGPNKGNGGTVTEWVLPRPVEWRVEIKDDENLNPPYSS